MFKIKVSTAIITIMIVVSMRANRIKTDALPEEIKKVAYFYEKLLKND
jgi:hypothetical protein